MISMNPRQIILLSLFFSFLLSCERSKVSNGNAFDTTKSYVSKIVNSTNGLVLRAEPKKNSKKLRVLPFLSEIEIDKDDLAGGVNSLNNGKPWLSVKIGEEKGFVSSEFVSTKLSDLHSIDQEFRVVEFISYLESARFFAAESNFVFLDKNGKVLFSKKIKNVERIWWGKGGALNIVTMFGDAGYSKIERLILNPLTRKSDTVFEIVGDSEPSGQCHDSDKCSCDVTYILIGGKSFIFIGRKALQIYKITKAQPLIENKLQNFTCWTLNPDSTQLIKAFAEKDQTWNVEFQTDPEDSVGVKVNSTRYRLNQESDTIDAL